MRVECVCGIIGLSTNRTLATCHRIQRLHMSDESPITIGDFKVIRQIGAGGMGIVYLAKQQSLNRIVALKVLGQALNQHNAISRFRRESQAVARLSHPGIASVHYLGQDNGICYMAMEYIEGLSLREVIQRLTYSEQPDSSLDNVLLAHAAIEQHASFRFDEPTQDNTADFKSPEKINPYMSPQAKECMLSNSHIRRCCEIIRDAAEALHYAHEHGVIHRDIKPENIMLGSDGTTRIIDFGLARFMEDDTLTHTGQLVGTPLYMSPEQVTARVR